MASLGQNQAFRELRNFQHGATAISAPKPRLHPDRLCGHSGTQQTLMFPVERKGTRLKFDASSHPGHRLCLGKSARKTNLRTKPVIRPLQGCARLSASAHAVPTAHCVTPSCPLPGPRLGRFIPALQLTPGSLRNHTPDLQAYSPLNRQCLPSWYSINIYGMMYRFLPPPSEIRRAV